MIVGRGSLTLRAYNVLGPNMPTDPEPVLEALGAMAFDGFSGGEGKARGWISIEHMLDTEFTRETNFRSPFLVFALRIDKRRVAPSIYKARCIIELKATQAALGTNKVPLEERREIRRRVKEEMLAEATPSSAAYGVIWNLRRRRLYFASTSRPAIADLTELFDRCFALSLEARDTTGLGFDVARSLNLTDSFQDLMPSPLFAGALEAGESA